MSTILFLALAMVAVSAPMAAGYDEKFDKLDFDKIITDDALFNQYIDCFLSTGPCTADMAEELKALLPEVIREACEKCTTSQKGKIRKFVSELYEKKPNKAIEFHKKYDPKGEYEPKFAAFLVSKDD